jgi:mannose-1-phosphate guanylyltransferase
MSHPPANGKLWGIVLAGGEGTRVRTLLQHLCGGRGIKQFCAVIGRRSMLEHTLARVERLIPRERIVVVVSIDHRQEALKQLSHWPAGNIIYQPANRDTAPGILLPLAHVSHREPFATVAIFPADHFILDEDRFMASVQRAVAETQRFPRELTLLGMTPDRAEEGYGWIEPAGEERGRATRAVRRFWEKPSLPCAQELLARGALWNTFVCVARAATVWEMARQTEAELYDSFMAIRRALAHRHADHVTQSVYRLLRPVDFSTGVCERLPARLRVLPVPEVGWSDWGSVERIGDTLQRLGKMNDAVQRARSAASASQREDARPHPSLESPALKLRFATTSERS